MEMKIHQNSCDAAKAVLTEIFIVLNSYFSKGKKFEINYLSFILRI